MTAPAPAVRRRGRFDELALLLLVAVLAAGGYLLTELSGRVHFSGLLVPRLGVVVGSLVLAHVAVRRLAPHADTTLLPLAALLNGIGFVFVARLDERLAAAQALWTAVGVAAFVGTLLVVRRARALERYRYTFALAGVGALMLPTVPGIGRTINGARVWIHLGPLNFEPAEASKVLLVIFFAAYLVEKRELLEHATRRIGPLYVPDPRHFGPLLLAWGASMLVLAQQNDLGQPLLFFAAFVVMLYLATGRSAYLGAGLGLFVAGSVVADRLFAHVSARIHTWINPWPVATSAGYQLVQGLFALGSGGFAGTGLGLGSPGRIPEAATDFVFAAIGEELGLLGTVAVVVAFALLIASGYRIALRADRPFLKLLAAGLTTIVGIQTFIIIAGVTRVIPLTGITLPFISYGGSSLVANFVVLALLLRISDDVETRAAEQAAAAEVTRVGAA